MRYCDAGVLALFLGLCHCSSSSPATTRADASIITAPAPDSGRRDATRDSSHRAHPDSGRDTGHADAAATDAPTDCATPVAAPDATPVACGSRGGMRGLTHRSLVVGCQLRTYLIYLPESLDPTKPVPFVFVFHGYQMSGAEMQSITEYTAIADAEGIGVAFPDGEGGPDTLKAPWNVRGADQVVCGDGDYVSALGDDMGFVDAMKADVSEDQCLDGAHLFSTGFSMGGYFTHHIACYRGDMRAAAPHSGGTLADLSVCTTAHVPMIIFHGKADTVIDNGCDDPTASPDVGFPASATLWAAKNGCKATYKTVPADGDAGPDAGDGQCLLYEGCPADGQVEVCTFDGMGHCWAGGNAGDADINACPGYARATQLEWQFFKKYAW